MRTALITRDTSETKIRLSLTLEGTGKSEIKTGAGFLDHMLTLFAAHGHFELRAECAGDLEVDAHHTVEDMGIALGQAFDKTLGERRGIARYGSMLLPMDEALVMIALDVSGRPHLSCGIETGERFAGEMNAELFEEFFLGFTRAAGVTLHIKQLSGKNAHHIFEAAFKGFGRAMAQAAAIEAGRESEIPSTKGII